MANPYHKYEKSSFKQFIDDSVTANTNPSQFPPFSPQDVSCHRSFPKTIDGADKTISSRVRDVSQFLGCTALNLNRVVHV